MELFTALLVVAGISLALASMSSAAKRRQASLANWHAAARQLGLSCSGPEDKRTMFGELRGVPVRADFVRRIVRTGTTTNTEEISTEEKVSFQAAGDGRIPMSLQARRGSAFRSLGRFVFGGDQDIGDEEFDQVVELPAMDAYVCAALSSDARRHLWSLLSQGGEVRSGTLIYERNAHESQDRAWLVQMLQFVAQLGELLTVTPQTVRPRLAHNAVHDPSPGVRLRNLRFLVDPSTRTPPALVASTARALLSDRSAPVRLLSATQLGAEGHAVLSALASDPQTELSLRVEALRALHEAGAPVLDSLLPVVLRASPPELVCTALGMLDARGIDALSAEVQACTESEHESVRVMAATALGRLSGNWVEKALIGLLSDASSEVRRASAESLGVVGSVAAVEPLLPLAEAFGRAQLRQAARAAIGRIQSRLGNVEGGWVSLAENHELSGAVAIADGTATRVGEVSLVQEELEEVALRCRNEPSLHRVAPGRSSGGTGRGK